ncbi:hypothetical protein [Thermincola ferriacetica]
MDILIQLREVARRDGYVQSFAMGMIQATVNSEIRSAEEKVAEIKEIFACVDQVLGELEKEVISRC